MSGTDSIVVPRAPAPCRLQSRGADGGIFASRKAHRLAYRSQRQSPYDRAISQAFKRRHRLGADGGIGDPIDKPKGMRWATFDRKMEQVEAAEAVCDARLLRFVQKLSER